MESVEVSENAKILNDEERERLSLQNNRMVSKHLAKMLEIETKKNWDLFYKRNETRFFKDRHWTSREFEELLIENISGTRTLFEIGCGVGNFIFPLFEEKLNFKIIVCDLSPRAIDMVQNDNRYDPGRINAFQCDITTEDVFSNVDLSSVDIVTLIFVLSAIHPEKHVPVLKNVYKLLKPGGIILFRDYGLYDMAQLRFKPGHKIAENFYMRQDGTRSYYFNIEEVGKMLGEAGFEITVNTYVHRRTINRKEDIDVPRIFVQAKGTKPS